MAEEENTGLSDYIALMRRRRFAMVVTLLSGALLATLVALVLPTVYNAPAEFRVSRTHMADAQRNEDYVDEYVSNLTRDVLKAEKLQPIIEKLELYPDYRDDPGQQVALLKEDTHVDMVTQKILDQDSGREREIYAGFTVTYDSPTPEAAAAVPTELAGIMVEVGRQQRAEQAGRIAEVFNKQATDYGTRIAALERKLAVFKEENYARLPDAAGLNAAARERTEEDIGRIEQEMRALQQNRIFLQAQLNEARSGGPDVSGLAQLQQRYQDLGKRYDPSHPDMVSLRRQMEAKRTGRYSSGSSLAAQVENKRSELAETRQRYSEDHPDVRALIRDIASLEARIAAGEKTDGTEIIDNTSSAVMQLQTQLNANSAQMSSLASRAAELRGRLGSLDSRMRAAPEVQREYDALAKEIELEREKYSDLLRREMDSRGEQSAILAGARDAFDLVHSPNVPSAPAKPRRLAIILAGLIAAGILAIGVALLAEMIDGTVRGRRDITELLGVAPMAVIPEIRNSRLQALRLRRAFATTAALLAAVPVMYLALRGALT
jgi:uncharacterized protein involved in exopolysaccharide biosynthesis